MILGGRPLAEAPIRSVKHGLFDPCATRRPGTNAGHPCQKPTMPHPPLETREPAAPTLESPCSRSVEGNALGDLAGLAGQFCEAPMAAVFLVGPQGTRCEAACGMAALDFQFLQDFFHGANASPDGSFVVDDAALDGRFAQNELVTGAPELRFYASAPLVKLGDATACTVCVLDTVPRQLTEKQLSALSMLARQAALLLDLRDRAKLAASLAVERDRLREVVERHRSEGGELLELVLRGADLGLWDLELPSGRWTINARERAMLGYDSDEADLRQLDWKALIHPDDWPSVSTRFGEHLLGVTPSCEVTHRMRHRDGHWIWVLSRSVAVERDAQGRPRRVVGTHKDVTRRKSEDDERRKAGERLELALSGGDIGLWDLDVPSGTATYNDQWWRMFGYAPDEIEVVDGLWKSMVHPGDYAQARAGLARHMEGRTLMYEGEVRVRHKDGHWLWIQNRAKVVERAADGAALRIVGVNLNITERKLAEIRSAESERRLRGLTDSVPALMTELDCHERVVFCNDTFRRWLGMAPASLIDRPIRDVMSKAQYAALKPYLKRAFAGETLTFEHALRTRGGERTLRTNYLPQKNEKGVVTGVYCLTNDVTDLKEKQRQLDALARRDTLTGLPNRRSFEERVLQAMARARRTGLPICVMYLDLDRFKAINDSLGHAGGDAVLREFASRLTSSLRETDVAARFAGDEFVILLEDLSGDADAIRIGEKILAAMRRGFVVTERNFEVTTSIGIAMHRGNQEDLAGLLSRADAALDGAKADGRNRMKLASVSLEFH